MSKAARQIKYLIGIGVISAGLTGCNTMPMKNDLQTSELKTEIAIEHIKHRDLDSAKVALDEAIAKNPQNAQAYMMMGVTYQADGNKANMAQANGYFKKAISLDPDNAQIRNNYGQFLLSQGSTVDAIKEFSVAGDKIGYSSRENAYSNLGFAWLAISETQKAQSAAAMQQAKIAFEKSLQIDPNYPPALMGLSEAQYSTGGDNATSLFYSYEERVGINNMNASALWLGVRIANLNDDRAEITRLATMLGRKFPHSPEYKNYIAQKNDTKAIWSR